MAKYTIEYTCGHEGHREVQLFGPHKERERKLEWMSRECLCPECWRAKIEWIKSIPNLNSEKSSWLSPTDIEYLRVGLRRQEEKSEAEAAAAAEAASKKAAADAWLAENPRPQMRNLRQIAGAPKLGGEGTWKWNGKWYGQNGRRIYLDGKEYILTKEQKEEYEKGIAEFRAWREKAKAAGVAI